MKKINWCKTQQKGIKIIEPNENLSKEYIKTAEENLKTLSNLKDIELNMWLATKKYYIEYFASYSLLMKLGIKCEIHDCTIEIIKFLENQKIININISKKLERDKQLRIDNQYYLKNIKVNMNMNRLSNFLLIIKKALERLNQNKIEEIRKELINYPS